MRATLSIVSGGLLAIGLLLAVGWLGWSMTGQIPWGTELVVTFTLLFLVRLRAQWRPVSAVAENGIVEPARGLRQPRWASQLLWMLYAFVRQCSLRFEPIVFTLLAAAILYQVLAPPVLGLADNGDFGWLMGQVGLAYTASSSGESSDFINLHFLVSQSYSLADGYVSSELILVKATLLLNELVSADGFFDLRVLGVLHAVALLAVLLLILKVTRSLPKAPRLVSGVLLLVVFTDVGYVAYFNSLYREPASLIFLTLTIACALHCIYAPKPHLTLLLAYFAAAALFVAAKSHYAPQGALLAVFGLSLSRRWWDLWSYRYSQRASRWQSRQVAVLSSAIMALVVCLIGAWSYVWQPSSQREDAVYNLVFSDLLVHSPTPEADLDDLGLDRDLVKWVGSEASDEDTPTMDPVFKEDFFDHVTPTSLVEFYATHPVRTVGLLDRVARQGLSLRPEYLGNFEEASGFSPGAQSHAFDVWSNVRESFPSKSLAGFLVPFGLAVWAGVVVRRRCVTLQSRLLAELFILLTAMAAVEFVIACLSGGALDIVKRLFTFNLLLDIGVIMAASYIAKWWTDIVR